MAVVCFKIIPFYQRDLILETGYTYAENESENLIKRKLTQSSNYSLERRLKFVARLIKTIGHLLEQSSQ